MTHLSLLLHLLAVYNGNITKFPWGRLRGIAPTTFWPRGRSPKVNYGLQTIVGSWAHYTELSPVQDSFGAYRLFLQQLIWDILAASYAYPLANHWKTLGLYDFKRTDFGILESLDCWLRHCGRYQAMTTASRGFTYVTYICRILRIISNSDRCVE